MEKKVDEARRKEVGGRRRKEGGRREGGLLSKCSAP